MGGEVALINVVLGEGSYINVKNCSFAIIVTHTHDLCTYTYLLKMGRSFSDDHTSSKFQRTVVSPHPSYSP